MRVSTALKAYGLTEIEAKIYQTLLSATEARVYDLAKTADIPRTSVYKTLEDLKKRGLVLSFHKNNVLYYTAESPNRLMDLLEEKRQMMAEVLPDLQSLVNASGVKPTMKLYTGPDALKAAKEDVIATLRSMAVRRLDVIANADMYRLLPKYFPGWVKKRVAEKIHARLILPAEAKEDVAHFGEEAAKRNLSDVRFLPAQFGHQASVNIYANKIALFALKEGETSAIIIESAPLADMFRQFFEFNWQVLEPKA